jgi:HD-GYP domain-containing protein (c-di-GMP phosphodiesterase class II)
MTQNSVRLAEVMASLSLAIDMGVGQPMEWVMRCCQLGVYIGAALGLSLDEQRDIYDLSLLRHIGCTATATSAARLFGDETTMAELMTADPDNMASVMSIIFRSVAKGEPLLQRAHYIARIMSAGTKMADANHIGHCEVAERLIPLLGFDKHIQDAFWQIFERWDGKGIPHRLKGDALAPAVRILHLAQDAATFYLAGGVEAAVEVVRERADRLYDPAMVEVFCRQAPELFQRLAVESGWEAALSAEPGQPRYLTEADFDQALIALADFTDLKSPHTLGHSRAVAELAEASARRYGLPEADVVAVRRAACLHDIGRVGVSSAIWNKSGALTESEWERVRLHPYYTERIFVRSQTLSPLAAIAAMHHERLDGSGYHRGLAAPMVPPAAGILAVANRYCALTEPRPHRPTRSPEAAADELRREARAGTLDSKAVDAVLTAAGHRVRTSPHPSTTLSEREIEVLGLVARGLSNKQMAAQLSISQKTVGHHIQHIYNKIGVSTRAGATLYAVQNYLL